MYRRNSTIQSAKSIVSPYTNGFPSGSYSKSFMHSAQSTKQSPGVDTLNPEELFSRYSVAEVKTIQQRLRNDADIKQEELRLMVGERYRDLLQASSSIISMAASSQRVFNSIEECRGIIIAQEEPPLLTKGTSFGAISDRHLHTLQLLSAHVKVLLDAPEHLWRLIERKDYLSAAWLFLFTRVVHRALAHNDDQDEDSWSKAGIEVVTEFPLVQRQWEEVSSFRSQIIHKATLSLRETGLTVQGVCATLVTLHLLDSRPLAEAFSSLFTQRTKALASLISWKIDHNLPHSVNGRVYGSGLDLSCSRQYLPEEILQANQKALTTIIDTIYTSRQIFQIPPAQQMSLISFVLQSIQDDKPLQESWVPQLPSDLVPSTHSILTNSSSSAHFLLLPPSLQAYKPYIDLSSSSLMYSQAHFRQVLQDWLHKSSKSWRDASNTWLSNLVNVAEIWKLRTSIRKLISESDVEPSEKSKLTGIMDLLCHGRILSVWKTTLSRAQDMFRSELSAFLSNLEERITSRTPFQTPRPPVASQSSKAHDPVPFQQYQSSLKQQLLGRTGQIDAVLSTLEQCARIIQNGLSTVLSDKSEDGIAFGRTVTEAFQPVAEATSDSVITILEKETDVAMEDTDVYRLVGVANISDELRSSSIFTTHIGCREPVLHNLRSRLDSIFERVVQRWREQIIARTFDSWHSANTHINRQVFGSSPECFRSLLSLSDALRELGVGQYNRRHEPVVQESLRALIDAYLTSDLDEHVEQANYNIAFLKAITSRYQHGWQETTQALADKLASRASGRSDMEDIQQAGSEFLIRTQTLLSLLMPCATQLSASGESGNQSQFLLFGNLSSSKQEYQPALELAKPSSRFGLLLVNNAQN